MEWLEGEALGRRILREKQYEKARQNLAYECGRILARIHSIDVVEKIRDEKKFASIEALKTQLAKDQEHCLKLINK